LILVQGELFTNGGSGLSIAAIMAHEFAHIAQFRRGPNEPTIIRELHADFLAGWYLANDPQFQLSNVEPAFRAFYDRGDYQFNRQTSHGTPQQRLSAVKAGYQRVGTSLDRAYTDGLAFVKGL
jgi:predicted metalloprotease